ncbi:kinase-like protein, partial [Calocera cornea HHB12733]
MSSPDISGGGFGRVYQTTTRSGALVAVKVLFENRWVAQRALELSVREAWTWSTLSHPNIVPFLGVANYGLICTGALPQLCLISPWMDGGNIREYVCEHPSVDRFRLLLDMAKGLQYLHTRFASPIIHGDIKGSNVLIDTRGRSVVARITDFGLAHLKEGLGEDGQATTSTTSLGNLRWMAFERVLPANYGIHSNRASLSLESDYFELMRTFYEVLTGKIPFHGMSEMAVFGALQLGQNPPRQVDGNTHIDDGMWDLMQKAWCSDRDKRVHILREVLEYLEGVVYFNALSGTLDLNEHTSKRLRDVGGL